MKTNVEIWNDLHNTTQWGTCPHPLVARWAIRRWGGETKHAGYKVRLLEVGCGMGTQARWLGEHGFRVDAMDASENVVMRARAYNKRFDVLEDGAVKIGVGALPDCLALAPEGYYDGALDVCCLQHVQKLTDSLAAIARVIKPGGSMLSIFAATDHTPKVRPADALLWRMTGPDLKELFGRFFTETKFDAATYTDGTDLISHWVIEATK